MEHYTTEQFTCIETCDKKSIKKNDLPSGQYFVNRNIRFKSSMLRSDLCNYSDAYIVVIDLLAAAANEDDEAEKSFAFKNNAPFRSCISKLNGTLIVNAKVLDVFVPMYDLLEYSQSYSMTSGSLWNCYRDEIDDVDDNASDSKSFEYKTKIIVKTPKKPLHKPQMNETQTNHYNHQCQF